MKDVFATCFSTTFIVLVSDSSKLTDKVKLCKRHIALLSTSVHIIPGELYEDFISFLNLMIKDLPPQCIITLKQHYLPTL